MTRSSRREERELLAETYAKVQRRRAATRAIVPQVGIVFVVRGKPFIDSTPVTEAESYEYFKIHDRTHYKYWEQLRGMGAGPCDL